MDISRLLPYLQHPTITIDVSHRLPLLVVANPDSPVGLRFSSDPEALTLQLRSGLPPDAEVLYVGIFPSSASVNPSDQHAQASHLLEPFKCIPVFILVDYLRPFLDVIHSDETGAPVTGVALSTNYKILCLDVLAPDSDDAIHSFIDAVTSCCFTVTDRAFEKDVLTKILLAAIESLSLVLRGRWLMRLKKPRMKALRGYPGP